MNPTTFDLLGLWEQILLLALVLGGNVRAAVLPPEEVAGPEEQPVQVGPPATQPARVVRRPVAAATRQVASPATQPAIDPAEQLPATRAAHVDPLPDDKALAAARHQIWKKFRADYDKHAPADRLALAHRLLKLAMHEEDPAARLALLREARDLAADVRDLQLALRAAEAVAFFYDTDAVREKLAVLSAAAWADDEEESARAVMQAWLGLSNEAAAGQRFDVAVTAAAKALAVASHWGDEAWVAQTSHHLDQLRGEQEQARLVESAKRTLSAHPDDPQASLVVGCHLAAEGKWDEALPLLEKSSDPAMKLIARAERENPAKPG